MVDFIDDLKKRAGITEKQLNEVGGTRAKAASTQIVNAIRQGQADDAIRAIDQIQDGGTAALTAIFAFTTLQQTNQASAFLQALQTISESKTRIDEVRDPNWKRSGNGEPRARIPGGGVPGAVGYMRKYGGAKNAALDISKALANNDEKTAEQLLKRVDQKQAIIAGISAALKLDQEELATLMAWLSR